MALYYASDFRSGNSTVESGGNGGTFSYATGLSFGLSERVLQVNPVSTATGYISVGDRSGENANGSLAASVRRNCQVAFKAVTLPASGTEQILVAAYTGVVANKKCSLRVSSAGALSIYDTNDTIIGSASAAGTIVAGTWYMIEMQLGSDAGGTINGGASDPIKVWVSDTLVFDTTANLGTSNLTFFRLGRVAGTVSYDMLYGQAIVGNERLYAKKRVVTLLPEGNGTNNWTLGTGASDYTQVNELPASTSNYVKTNSVTNDTISLTIPDASDANVKGAIYAIHVGWYAKETTSVTSSVSAKLGDDVAFTALNISATFVERFHAVASNSIGTTFTRSWFNSAALETKSATAHAIELAWACVVVISDLADVTGAATASASATLDASGVRGYNGASAPSASAFMDGVGKHTAIASAALSANATLDATGKVDRFANSTSDGFGTMVAEGYRTRFGSTQLDGVGTLDASGEVTPNSSNHYGAVTLTCSGDAAAVGVRTRTGATALGGACSLAAAGVKSAMGATAMAGVATLVAGKPSHRRPPVETTYYPGMTTTEYSGTTVRTI